MGAVWPAAWAETEVASVAHRLEQEALMFRHGHVLAASFSEWYTHAVQNGAVRWMAAHRISALLRASLYRWSRMARAAREIYFAQVWYQEHLWHWTMLRAVKKWRDAASWSGYARRAALVGRNLVVMRQRARCLAGWRAVVRALQSLREGCDALCWEKERSQARRALRAWAAWTGGQALLDGRAGVAAAAAAADVHQHVQAARGQHSVAALAAAQAAAKTQPVVHCFLSALGQPRVVATHHHAPAVALAGRHMWLSVGGRPHSELPTAMRLGVLALPFRCWREYCNVRREHEELSSVARAHGDVLRAFCALRAWQGTTWRSQSHGRARVERSAEVTWYRFWRGRMRGELALELVTRREWDHYWQKVHGARSEGFGGFGSGGAGDGGDVGGGGGSGSSDGGGGDGGGNPSKGKVGLSGRWSPRPESGKLDRVEIASADRWNSRGWELGYDAVLGDSP